MPLLNVIKNKWEILFYIDKNGDCATEQFLEVVPVEYKDRMLAHIERLSIYGRGGMPSSIFHQAAKGDEIKLYKKTPKEKLYSMYGLICGTDKYRLYAILQEENKTVIFTHGVNKSSQKTDRKDKNIFAYTVYSLSEEGEL